MILVIFSSTHIIDKILNKTLKLYKYCFASGGIMNYKIESGLIYRVSADGMPEGDKVFSKKGYWVISMEH